MLLYALLPTVTLAASPPSDTWTSGLAATHFWDCNGMGCDSTTLQPWNPDEYIAAPQYAPIDPANHGGSVYGEKMWLTGAASDDLADLMGEDDGCCGADTDSGACGKCVLVRNPNQAVNSDWTAVVMKKSRCPPKSNGCEAGNAHLDIAAPGYDNLQYSTSNVCGNSGTILSREQSSICGDWYDSGASTTEGCDCSTLPTDSTSELLLKDGCDLFTSWGWTTGSPTLEYQVVDCPDAFKEIVKEAFDADGVNYPDDDSSSSSSNETAPGAAKDPEDESNGSSAEKGFAWAAMIFGQAMFFLA